MSEASHPQRLTMRDSAYRGFRVRVVHRVFPGSSSFYCGYILPPVGSSLALALHSETADGGWTPAYKGPIVDEAGHGPHCGWDYAGQIDGGGDRLWVGIDTAHSGDWAGGWTAPGVELMLTDWIDSYLATQPTPTPPEE